MTQYWTQSFWRKAKRNGNANEELEMGDAGLRLENYTNLRASSATSQSKPSRW